MSIIDCWGRWCFVKIASLSKKSIFLLFLYFLHSWGVPLFAEYSRYFSLGLTDKDCGTLADPNYQAAFHALQDAMDFCFKARWIDSLSSAPYFFPQAGDGVLDISGESAFYYEGSLFWQTQASSCGYGTASNDFLCKRVMRKATQIDMPRYIFQGEDQPSLYPAAPIFLEEERIFKLYKDYSALLSIFYLLEQDLVFIRESNKAFLHRRIHSPQDYYKPALTSGYISLQAKDLRNSLRYYNKQYQINSQRVEEYQKKALTYCKRSLDYCIANHRNPLAHVNRGLLDYLEGDVIEALDHINQALEKAEAKDLEAVQENALLLKGRSELEAGLYANAILTLTELIDKHPCDKDAYFERAGAYFELGNFDLSLGDYLTAEVKLEPIGKDIETVTFALGLTRGIVQGGVQAGTELIPSLLSSLQGIGHGLWAFAQDPVQISTAFVQASQDCIDFIKNHTPQETLLQLAPELKELIEKWDTFENEKRGEITGIIIGKYGVDIFAGAGFTKIMKSYRELKRANNLLTFEAMAISERNKSIIKLVAAEKAQARKEILTHANLKIQSDKQGKHLVDHRNYILLEKKSILAHADPQKLANDFAGKGMKAKDLPPGAPGYQELVNFEEFIGYIIDRDTGEKIATNWGKIHYAKDGVHIVPTRPR